MKKFIIAAMMLLSCNVLAGEENFEEFESNFKLTHDEWVGTFREIEQNWHVELGYNYKQFQVMYRFADLQAADNTYENRIKLSQELYEYGILTLGHRLEYRWFTNEEKEDYFRYRLMIGAEQPITDRVSLWVLLQPRVSFRDEENYFDARDRAGFKFKFDDVTVSPFIERYASDKWSTVDTYLAGFTISMDW